MPAIGDVYQVIDNQEMMGQKVINVYFYRLMATPVGFVGAGDVAQAFIDQVLPDMLVVQTEDVTHTSIRVTNLFDAVDAAEALISEVGENGSNSLGTFEAFPFRLVGDNASVRSGSKRLAGVAEDGVDDGVVTDVGLLAALNDVAEDMGKILTFGLLSTSLVEPTIVKRILTGGDYVLPSSPEEAVLSIVLDVLFNALVTSQTSRKIGRGE